MAILQNDVLERDYLKEAFEIILGHSMYLPQRQHLVALKAFYDCDATKAMDEAEAAIEGEP